MKKKWLLLITSVLALVLAIALAGCASTPTPSPWVTSTSGSWTTFTTTTDTTDDWPAGNAVVSVTQDNQGVLWVASLQGLTRFDGNHWEIYTKSPPDIICSARDKQGNLWFGTYGEGVFKYTGKKWQNFTPNNTSNGLPGIMIRDVFVDNEDNLWFATVGNVGQRTAPIDYGVTRYDGTDWTSILDPYTGVVTIFQDSDGNMWFGTNAGVIRYDGSHWQTFTREDGLADNYVVAICQDNQGNMWFGTKAGVIRYDGSHWQTFTREDGLVSDAIHCMLKDSRGNLWFGSYSIDGYYGISRFDGTQWQNFDPWRVKDDKYPPNYHYSVISIFQDNEGNLWFATSFGLVRYNPS